MSELKRIANRWALTAILLLCTVHAGVANAAFCEIDDVYVDRIYRFQDGVVFIYFSGTFDPSCSGCASQTRVALPAYSAVNTNAASIANKGIDALLSLVMTAMAADKQVFIRGDDTQCVHDAARLVALDINRQ